ncbi:hypothetical protein M9458_045824, partial [Cirrhinus mrigala]
MSSAASGAADFPPSADSTEGRRQPSPGQTPVKPASKPSGSRSSSSTASKLGGKGNKGREGEQVAQGTRVLFMVLKLRRFGKPRSGLIALPNRTRAAHCVYRASPTAPPVVVEAAAGGEYVGCGPAFWGGGCLQSELIQYHINKRLKKSGRMQRKASGETQPGPAAQATSGADEPVTQQNEALQDEIQRLEDENEDLR